jgi:hypothetical protein
LQRLNYQNNITPVMEIREKRIKIWTYLQRIHQLN